METNFLRQRQGFDWDDILEFEIRCPRNVVPHVRSILQGLHASESHGGAELTFHAQRPPARYVPLGAPCSSRRQCIDASRCAGTGSEDCGGGARATRIGATRRQRLGARMKAPTPEHYT